MDSNDEYIAKMVQAGIPAKRIADKLGMTEDDVVQRWKYLQQWATSIHENGMVKLVGAFTVLCNQFELLGGSIKLFSMTLNKALTPKQIDELLKLDKEQLADALKNQYIVLPAFMPEAPHLMEPQDLLKQTYRTN